MCGGAVGHHRQRLDVEYDVLERILGERGALRHHHGDRLADVAHLGAGDHRLAESLRLGKRIEPQRDHRDVGPDLPRGDDRVHA